MQINEKLEVFHDSTVEVAEREKESMLEDYRKELEEKLETFRSRKLDEMERAFQMEETRIRREINSQVSGEITEQKRLLDECQRSKKHQLFKEVERQILAYRKTEEYVDYLASKIKMAKEFARGEEIIIYLNRDDSPLKERLEQRTQAALTMSTVPFGGGIRAVVRSRNVLIDESFDTKIAREREEYTF